MSNTMDGLQFETAEPRYQATSSVCCATCGRQITTWFEVNGATACAFCKSRAVKAEGASHAPALLKASGLGLLAAAAGSALYYGVAVITGYEIGLISIAVGLLVGLAVRKGAGGRGGWRYQVLAVFLTYLAIASTYVPRVMKAMAQQRAAAGAARAHTPAARPPDGADLAPAATGSPTDEPTSDATSDEPSGAGVVVRGVFALLVLALALPFLGGLENVMGLVIIAIGIWEAWKVNRARPFAVAGPFTVAGAPGPGGG